MNPFYIVVLGVPASWRRNVFVAAGVVVVEVAVNMVLWGVLAHVVAAQF